MRPSASGDVGVPSTSAGDLRSRTTRRAARRWRSRHCSPSGARAHPVRTWLCSSPVHPTARLGLSPDASRTNVRWRHFRERTSLSAAECRPMSTSTDVADAMPKQGGLMKIVWLTMAALSVAFLTPNPVRADSCSSTCGAAKRTCSQAASAAARTCREAARQATDRDARRAAAAACRDALHATQTTCVADLHDCLDACHAQPPSSCEADCARAQVACLQGVVSTGHDCIVGCRTSSDHRGCIAQCTAQAKSGLDACKSAAQTCRAACPSSPSGAFITD